MINQGAYMSHTSPTSSGGRSRSGLPWFRSSSLGTNASADEKFDLDGLGFPAAAPISASSTTLFDWNGLTKRSRMTNFAVLLLALVSGLSILLNVRLYLDQQVGSLVLWRLCGNMRSDHRAHNVATTNQQIFRRPRPDTLVPLSLRATLPTSRAPLKHLVIIPGHAIWLGSNASRASLDQDWILEPFQKNGDVRAYLKHIAKGAEIAGKDPDALLIYSGGVTRHGATISEATSYARLAEAGNVYEKYLKPAEKNLPFERVTTEVRSYDGSRDYALDSFQNLLFSIARFKEYVGFTGHYPTQITTIGYRMKRKRYQDVHRAALRWPSTAFKYIGIDNDHDVEADYQGERQGGLEPFIRDSYACKGVLLAKRRKRNPYRRFHPYHSSVPELAPLFEYCPRGNALYSGRLPWD
ncbi:BZ3500_MvSof-1268-A1-R1_Chr1-1g00856 [Microbotryum saponariae]|uniref:BZ3500_MvSof-1268-A1-R1_Chr1-1g00856 protein n=1 Tax=Microbotryum saponariae TaxID=289078 RepID=A0A2X0KHH3_9BASI|nr:BZ3500_MvSof-1268-A1-R1_Chr1-1g00856 [Microbotryum saponariae]SCZ92789.1 BZ3501_MvSof-1269-A2-R1_Chr1-1g00453 [Microbotryum saponariae]